MSAALEGERVRVRVADDGPGIRQEFHERVFRMFQTLRPRDEVEGSGVGLAIVKKSVEVFGRPGARQSAGQSAAVVFTWPLRWPERERERCRVDP
ncbi:MAG: hypothetical protein IPN17_38495 [Deltaproteobacteria bacterium]|nr:hypothetical protein [Deltaproteobacteria bacterium]